MQRRGFLLVSGLVAGAAALGWRVAPAGAEGLVAARQYRVCDATVKVLSDEFIDVGAEMLIGVSRMSSRPCWRRPIWLRRRILRR